jgi:hypothetical protein
MQAACKCHSGGQKHSQLFVKTPFLAQFFSTAADLAAKQARRNSLE